VSFWLIWVKNWARTNMEFAFIVWERLRWVNKRGNLDSKSDTLSESTKVADVEESAGESIGKWKRICEIEWEKRALAERELHTTQVQLAHERQHLQSQLMAEQLRHQKAARENYQKLDAMLVSEKEKLRRADCEVNELETARAIARASVLEADADTFVDEKIEAAVSRRQSMRQSFRQSRSSFRRSVAVDDDDADWDVADMWKRIIEDEDDDRPRHSCVSVVERDGDSGWFPDKF